MATMNISLPDELRQFVHAQVARHGYTTASEYVRELIRKQRDAEALRDGLPDGARTSAPAEFNSSEITRESARGRSRA